LECVFNTSECNIDDKLVYFINIIHSNFDEKNLVS